MMTIIEPCHAQGTYSRQTPSYHHKMEIVIYYGYGSRVPGVGGFPFKNYKRAREKRKLCSNFRFPALLHGTVDDSLTLYRGTTAAALKIPDQSFLISTTTYYLLPQFQSRLVSLTTESKTDSSIITEMIINGSSRCRFYGFACQCSTSTGWSQYAQWCRESLWMTRRATVMH